MSNEKNTDMTLQDEELRNESRYTEPENTADSEENADLTLPSLVGTDTDEGDVNVEASESDMQNSNADESTLVPENLFGEPVTEEENLFGESEHDTLSVTEDEEMAETDEADEDSDLEGGEELYEEQNTSEGSETDGKESAEGEDAPKKVKNTPTEKTRRIDSIFDFAELFVFTLAAVFIITSFFFKYSVVDGPSMMNTLHHQDRLLLTDFMYEPEGGDVVVIYSEALDKVLVKRIIATEGETVRITPTDVYVNGKKLIEPYVYTQDCINPFGYRYEIPDGKEYIEITVPEGEVYIMGDHRNNSDDSRDRGTLSEDAIIGKVIYRFFPFDSSGKIESVRITEE